ncbi:cytoplasmic dynein 1 intermediate chain 1 isoform X1 [Hippocampus zosterae]|uniref:cytoplasmic dynein 1 intermediate chain 1 isoform X1 n=1 Tax=Hippocampus zosterae TaxID=109293 RepID=UPI00223CF905|nr:cytoplasmic dynein 1 intermediate chain 1 isoform X1 [Hippocampus zosterae]XP_051928152.1 cytoplasmic dynein 1 intermediate chain 1 isoform X1 [Hippocampus zosterae]XP_051928153.1 cytoplasmic dynein 1 intermediate chain 1 isoform X1 [Hippocampus zosterae]
MSDKSDLKAELERKKQRLAQIREEKKRKEEERKKKEGTKKAESQQKTEATSEDSDLDRKRRETEALLQSIGISPEPSLVPNLLSPSKSMSTPSETESQDSADSGAAGRYGTSLSEVQRSRTLQWDTDPSVLQLESDSELGRRMQKLGASKITQVDFQPKELVLYSKETQTPHTAHLSEVEEEEEDEELMETKPGPELELQDEDDKENKAGSFPVLRELTEEERQQILHSSEFQNFFDCSIRVMERALAESGDIFFDYGGRALEDKEGDLAGGSSLSFTRLFYDDHWSKHRVVTCLDWSPQYPELLVASYNNNEDAPHEPDGVALVWNIKFKKATPEYIFHCQSPVVSVGFAKFHPNLVVGGTYSGQIVLWDNRSHRRTPVQRTPLSAAAHTHPVYCVNVVGTQNANNLITVSTDGRMCSWSLDMLSQPQESMELVYNKSKPVAVTGMAFPTGDVNNYVVGSEEGTVYTASRHGSKAGICEMFEGHQGPVTGISCHNAVGTVDFSHLFITCSFDWTVKLWSTKQNKPLYSFEDNADYVYDVMWSPVHPAIFASVDGMGRLDLWNLNNDTEVPTASVTIEGASALNRVRWSSGGKEVAVGDSEGRVWVYDTGELSVAHSDDWTRFARTLMEIRANHEDGEEEGPMELAS